MILLKTVSLILCIVILASVFAGCADNGYDVREEQINQSARSAPSDIVPQTTDVPQIPKTTDYKTLKWRNIKKSSYYTYINNKYGYASLNDTKLRELYEKIESAMFSVSNKPDEKGRYTIPQIRVKNEKLSQQRIKLVMQALSLDYPYVFWLNNMFGYYYDSDDTLVQLYAVQDCDSLQNKINIFSAAVSDIIASVEGGLSEYDREKLVNNYIIDNCSYDEYAENVAENWQSFCAYGAVVDKFAICGGYAYTAQLLLNLLGVDSISVTGKGREELHVWNQVKIDGLWYNLDVTWNDNGEISRYDYFNLSDDEFCITHTPGKLYTVQPTPEGEPFNITLRECANNEANYYLKECVSIGEFNDEFTMICSSELAKAALAYSEYFSMIVMPGNDYDEAVNALFYESPYVFFNCISEANKLCGDLLNQTEVSVTKKETINVITVKLCYKNAS